ncbi:hypothetical protein RvY_01185 [Ramazzottius varieornatus]|uniref:MARVEL domain-containing protein n=1 Tax=Ramazzottius varieornatus TaxID=947166 RepID=A0A1D1UMK6_RAMVA|nr:hypothetical protein RvY_01185 [Ramazzottius varieornatus]
MDPFAGIFPVPVPAPNIYRSLKTIGVLGVVETVVALVAFGFEVTGLVFNDETYGNHNTYHRSLCIFGMCAALSAAFAGIWGFLSQLERVRPRARHCMFLLGILWTFFCGALSYGLMIHSIDAARTALKTRKNFEPSSTTRRPFMEAEFHVTNAVNTVSPPVGEDTVLAEIRCGAALAYAALGCLFLSSFLLNCHNLRRIMKHGHTCFPKFRYPWMSRHWSTNSTYIPTKRSMSNSLKTDPGSPVIQIDKYGSLWLLSNAPADPDNAGAQA